MWGASFGLALVAALLLAPGALAAVGEQVDITQVRAPERTAAGKPFPVSVDLHNKGGERTVYLFAALYEGQDAQSPCGPITDPRFRTWTPVYQAPVRLAANARITWPAPDETWGHRYGAEHVEPRETTDELCVFVAERQQASGVDWLDFHSLPLRTRGQNGVPTGDFTWTPETPRAAQDVRFVATAEDPERDPLTYSWDFGHHNASGRARAQGREVAHPFYPDGTFTVTLRVSDGFDEHVVTKDVRVLVADATGGGSPPDRVHPQDGRDAPLPVILAPLAALAAALLRRR